MTTKASLLTIVVTGCACLLFAQPQNQPVPRAWEDDEVARFEVPLAKAERSPQYPRADVYYNYAVRPVYRGFPIYLPGQEPEGYLESLKQRDPEIVFDAANIHSPADWIRAGELVFDSPVLFRKITSKDALALRDPQYYQDLKIKQPRNGIYPYAQYVVRKKGVVELGYSSCANCHTRVLPDGSTVKGAQGDFPFFGRPYWVYRNVKRTPQSDADARENEFTFFGAPWISPVESLLRFTFADQSRLRLSYPPGVIPRQGTSGTHPTRVPSLIGVKDIRYLDATGLVRHRSTADLMRYAIINMGLDFVAHYGDFQPASTQEGLADPETRYSDEQLYALAMYLYSLQPPPNPNRTTPESTRGKKIFQKQGCSTCHVPPLYTANRLTPALGFVVPSNARATDDILDICVGTDPTLAMKTRRGTGYYKIPSLRGVWMRNGFGHGGEAATLEEWFDPARVEKGYSAKGFQFTPGPITGHTFGLGLSVHDRKALIAFLRTL